MKARSSTELLGAGLVVLSATCFGTLGPVTRYADEAGVGTLALVTWRAAIGATLIFGVLLLQAAAGRRAMQRIADVPARSQWMVAAAGAANAVVNLAMFIAFLRIDIGLSLLIFYLYPAYLAVISVTWFGERLDRTRWLALGLALLGMLLVLGGEGFSGEADPLGIGLALLAGVGQCFYALAVRHGFAEIRAGEASVATMAGAAFIYLVVALVIGQAATLATPFSSVDALWPILVAGVIGAGVPTLCFMSGIRLLGPARAAILSMIEPVVGTLLAALLLAEQPTLIQAGGGALIIGAAILLQLRPRAAVAEHEAVADA